MDDPDGTPLAVTQKYVLRFEVAVDDVEEGRERKKSAVHNCWANFRVRLRETPRKLELRRDCRRGAQRRDRGGFGT